MQRSTKQRTAIWNVFQRSDRPLSPLEAHQAAKKQVSGLGMATVYRTLNALLDEGLIRSLELPGHAPRYERADLEHHHHFHCKRCDRVYDLDGCALKASYRVPAGFKVEHHEITLSGICAACARA